MALDAPYAKRMTETGTLRPFLSSLCARNTELGQVTSKSAIAAKTDCASIRLTFRKSFCRRIGSKKAAEVPGNVVPLNSLCRFGRVDRCPGRRAHNSVRRQAMLGLETRYRDFRTRTEITIDRKGKIQSGE